MAENYEIDNLDRELMYELQQDARRPFQDIARKLIVSGGTIHVRYNKLKEAGIVLRTKLILDPVKLGYTICAFIGINLHKGMDYKIVIKKLMAMPEIQEAHLTTGKYSIFIKVYSRDIHGLQNLLMEQIQEIPQVQSTETFVSLEIPFQHDMPLK